MFQRIHNQVEWFPWGEEAFLEPRKKASQCFCPKVILSYRRKLLLPN
nr:hypothetical protein [Paenibacillus sp. SYP-B3998]